MTISEIAYRLNDLASLGHPFGTLQSLRLKYYGGVATLSPFSKQGIKDGYAFHTGGRRELQFNFGRNLIKSKEVFRFGVAFSLKRGRSLHNPKAELKPLIDAFNKFLKANPKYFEGLKMWYHSNTEPKAFFNKAVEITGEMFEVGNFIFIGKYLDKTYEAVNERDLLGVLDTFDYLMPLYSAVQFRNKNEKRIARLCWNERSWVLPSGKNGKSKNIDTHEGQFGYGHEEWLFDVGKTIDGYHYGFLEPIRKHYDAFVNKTYDVWLYSMREKPKGRFWVGEIDNLEVIDKKEADRVKDLYEKKGWLSEMKSQLNTVGIKSLSNYQGINIFNVRFKPSDYKVNYPLVELGKDHAIRKYQRYTFAEFIEPLNVEKEQDSFSFDGDDREYSNKSDAVKSSSYIRQPSIVEIEFLHESISKKLTTYLKKEYGDSNVKREKRAGYGSNRIDIVVKQNNRITFYEIKTYPSVRNSIREALGQLIEYSHWVDQNKASKLIIVTQPSRETINAASYVKHLREIYNIPVYYQFYDLDKNTLSEEY